ncbi:RAMP superfamily CRISPR-associated protein [Minwuia sp. IMCC3077]|uniref:RAMP superfamily CRISPR-associated protein n=1 Tax=Minwuia sp. IMCC3077 TaxID=3040676 RepID=UPI002478C3FF|nr:RAMP superfamily CRISPR-associated protein [Minwuia sp. IMCC3077]
MRKRLLKAEVVIRTEAPLSISMPVAERQRANDWGNFPVMGVGQNDEGEIIRTGYLPASTVRGALRRFAVLPDMEAAAQAGKHYTLPEAYMALVGQDADSEKQPDEIDLVTIQKEREDNPVIDLFGSGLGVKSRLIVSNFVPEHPVLPEPFTNVRKDLEDTEHVLDDLKQEDRGLYLSRNVANRKRAQARAVLERLERDMRRRKSKGEDVTDMPEQIAAANELVEKYEADMGGMGVSTRAIFTFFALPMGLELKGRFVVRGYRDRDLPILLQALDGLSRFPVLGAQSARGCGQVSGQARIEVDERLEQVVFFGGFSPSVQRHVTENA